MCNFLKLFAGGLLIASTAIALVLLFPRRLALIVPYGIFAFVTVWTACQIAEALVAAT